MKNLKGTLILTTCLICVICIGITAAISYSNALDLLQEREGESIELLAEKSAEQIHVWLREQSEFLDTVAASMEVEEITDHAKLYDYLSTLLEGYNEDGFLYDIYYTSTKNQMVAGSGYEPDPGLDFTERSWFVGALSAEGLYCDPPYRDADSGRIVITIARKITVGETVVGVLAEDIFVDTVVDIVNRCKVPENSYAMLIDQNLGLAVHPGYGYVADQPVHLGEVDKNAYRALLDSIHSSRKNPVYVEDYDGVERAIYTAVIGDYGWILGIAVDRAVLDSDAILMIKGFGIASILSLLVGIGIVSVIAGRVTKPIGQLTKIVREKDVSSEIKINVKNEVGQLSKRFNELTQSLRGLLNTSSDAVCGIRESSKVLGTITNEVVGGAKRVESEMGSIKGAMENQQRNVEVGRESLGQFHDKVEYLKEHFGDINHALSQVNGKIQENAQVAEKLKESSDESTESIKNLESGVQNLEEKSQSITNIIAVINSVSAKTNMLALNASIEAARAGEAGHGFAVVADQIRDLSGQTKEATENIRHLIGEIQGQIGSTVGEIKSSADLFAHNSEIADNVHKMFGELALVVAGMDEKNQVFRRGLEEFVRTENDITDSFVEIDKGANSCLGYSRQALEIAVEQAQSVLRLKEFEEKLNQLSIQLNAKTEMFKV